MQISRKNCTNGCLQKLDQRTKQKTAEKNCLLKSFVKILKYIIFLSGYRARTWAFDKPLLTSCMSDIQNSDKK